MAPPASHVSSLCFRHLRSTCGKGCDEALALTAAVLEALKTRFKAMEECGSLFQWSNTRRRWLARCAGGVLINAGHAPYYTQSFTAGDLHLQAPRERSTLRPARRERDIRLVKGRLHGDFTSCGTWRKRTSRLTHERACKERASRSTVNGALISVPVV